MIDQEILKYVAEQMDVAIMKLCAARDIFYEASECGVEEEE